MGGGASGRDKMFILPKRVVSMSVVLAGTIGLAGCFDLEQKTAIRHDGSGSYTVVVKADGIVGEGLNEKHADIEFGDDRAITHVSHQGDATLQTSEVKFRDLSDLHVDDDELRLTVKGKKLLGLAGSEMNFHRAFHVDSARRHHQDDDGDDDRDHLGHEILQSMFGDHTYTYTLWLPGTIERIAPVRIDGRVVHPTVWSDASGHTIVWKMKLTDMFLAKRLDFDVDFSAQGDFHAAQSQPGNARHDHHQHGFWARHDRDDDHGDNRHDDD
jgi:hypothetical protein